MKLIVLVGLIIVLASAATAQSQPRVLATATGHTLTIFDISPNAQSLINGLPAAIAKTRADLLAQMVNDELFAAEAKARGVDPAKLRESVQAKASEPTEAEINVIYQANLAAFDNKPLKEVRDQLVNYLKNEAGRKELQNFIERLRPKYKIVPGKDVNASGIKRENVLVNVSGRPISDQEFEEKNKLDIYETSAAVSDQVLAELNELLYSALVMDEAKSLGTDAGSIISLEVTSKMHDYSDGERNELETAFRDRLFAKYNVKILYEEPEPVVQNISLGNGPSQGPANAPVTIVMFSDFQCPACAATHPILKKVLAEYVGKIHFVVRDYPLVNRHEHALRAALAAGAANAQGKFFEYIEILYKNQTALDDASLRKYAADLGLNMKQFELDFKSERIAAEVRNDMAEGTSYRISATPTIYINGVIARDLSSSGFRRTIIHALRK